MWSAVLGFAGQRAAASVGWPHLAPSACLVLSSRPLTVSTSEETGSAGGDGGTGPGVEVGEQEPVEAGRLALARTELGGEAATAVGEVPAERDGVAEVPAIPRVGRVVGERSTAHRPRHEPGRGDGDLAKRGHDHGP